MDTMNPQQMQEMSPEEAKASMGIATNLMDQLMRSQAPQKPETAPVEGEPPAKPTLRDQYEQQPENEDLGEIKQKIAEIKGMIEEALNENDEQGETETTPEQAE